VNHGTIGAEAHLPFGGTKATGNGHREVGQAALEFFSEWKSVYVDYSGRLQRAQIDTTFVDEGWRAGGVRGLPPALGTVRPFPRMRLPHFPLHAVLFPHLPLPLHVFEERYRAMARTSWPMARRTRDASW
jgi:hypothetical protein